jgi:tetratricopeptide (TPR) repeat protein
MKHLAAVLVLTFFALFTAPAQHEEVRDQMLGAKKLLREGNTSPDQGLLLQARGMTERVYQFLPTPLTLYYLTQAEYELVRFGVGRSESDLYDRFIDPAIDHAEQLVKQNPDWSEAHSLLATLYAMKISKSWIQGPLLGPKASSLADQATRQDSLNPRAWLGRCMMKLNTPSFFGGSVEEALASIQKSVNLFESNQPTDSLQPDWGYLDALAWLGKSYDKLDQPDLAVSTYRKALQVEPNFGWVKFSLLPALEKKLAQQVSK